MRESRTLGSVRGAVRKDGPYRDLPKNTTEEQKNNEALGNVLNYSKYESLEYKHPES